MASGTKHVTSAPHGASQSPSVMTPLMPAAAVGVLGTMSWSLMAGRETAGNQATEREPWHLRCSVPLLALFGSRPAPPDFSYRTSPLLSRTEEKAAEIQRPACDEQSSRPR
ncbi:hypothetical protein SKAU_G00002160 [Synaphobranchus kaupii]|uniref:Uncharacterized protein n=1 Tax=Synaphobranchus kaupii TaxID=118154 RepID=A0A9Q1JBC4_SYNKA|nr:hypothetical protein SKAU_G00002160 [Synaphobranchus kaupii]